MIFGFGKPSASSLRPLRAEKAQACAEIHAGGFAHPWSAAEIARLIATDNCVGAAALDPSSSKLRGFVLSRVAADQAEILTIAVGPSFRNAGIARQLLAYHLSQLVGLSVRSVFLEVDPANKAACALYARQAFSRVGERPGYYRNPNGPPSKALVMQRLLK